MSHTPSRGGLQEDRLSERPAKAIGNPVGVWLEPLEDRRLLSVAAPTSTAAATTGTHAVTAAAATAAPVLAPLPNASVNVGKLFTAQAVATGSPVPTYSLSDPPSGVTINKTTGLISWTPTASQVGTRTLTVKATNSVGSSSTSFKVTVSAVVAPTITAPVGLTATAGGSFSYQVVATGNPAPSFSLSSAPTGMSITSSGLISWTPTAAQMGAQSVSVLASNSAGSASSTFGVTVVPDTTPPTAPTVSVGPITAVDSIPLSWTGSVDDVGVAGYRIYGYTPAVYRGHSGRGGGYTLVSPAVYTLLVGNVTSNSYTFTGLAPNSTHQYAVTAYDAAGNESAYSAIATGTTLLQPAFTWESAGAASDPPLTDVADYPLTFYLFTTGSPTPTLSLISAPAGVTFTPGQVTNSQLTYVIPTITWTPTEDQTGISYITMQATNSVGTYTYSIPVTVTPDTPQISISLNGGITYGSQQYAAGPSNYAVNVNPAYGGAANPQYGLSGTPFNFQVSSASNAGPTTYSLLSAPDSMSLDPNTGAGTWTPTKDQSGNTSVTLAATNSAGTSTLELSFPTYFTGAPGTPAATYSTSVSGTGTNNPTITWAAPADTTGIADYVVAVTDAHTGVTTTFDTQSTSTSYTLSGLGGQQYFVAVTPIDAYGNPGMTSPSVSIYALALPRLAWTVSTSNAVVGEPLTVQFTPGSGLGYSIASGPAGATIDPTTGLLSWTPTDPGTATFTVAASTNGWGTLDAIVSLSVYVTDAPTSLTVTPGTDAVSGAATLTANWSPPTQNANAVAGYQVQILSPSTSSTAIVVNVPSTSALSILLTDLGVTTGSSIQVTAFDTMGNFGIASNWVMF